MNDEFNTQQGSSINPFQGMNSEPNTNNYQNAGQTQAEATPAANQYTQQPGNAFQGMNQDNPFAGMSEEQNRSLNQSQTQSQFQNQAQPQFQNKTSAQFQNGTQPVYGNYQYSAGNGGNAGNKPPKKKKGKILIAVALVLVLILGGAGAAYFTYTTRSNGGNTQVASTDGTSAASTNQSSGTDKQVQVTTTSSSSAVVTDITEMVEEVMPAMVIIHNNFTASATYFGYTEKEEATASGSGIIVGQSDTELLVATNYHVIEGADTLEVIFCDDTTVQAGVKGTDSDMDLAVIAISLSEIPEETLNSIKIATLGDSNNLKLGEPAIAIGNALGYGQSVTTGVISALNREVEIEEGVVKTFIQTDAAINPGNSGGALLNINGEVIGINSNKLGGDVVEGMGYAIPISAAKPIIEELMNEETKYKVDEDKRGYLGIKAVGVTSDISDYYGIPSGVYVAEVVPGGAASAAGIQKDDVIVEFDGKEITSMEDLSKRLEYYAAGETVTIKVMRQNGDEYEEVELQVTLSDSDSTGGETDSNAGEDSDGNGGSHYPGKQPGIPGNGNNNGKEEEGEG